MFDLGDKHRKGEKMEGILIGIMDTVILKYCFVQWSLDHDIDLDDPDDLRCAITAYSHYVQNVLKEQCEVEEEEVLD